MLLFSILLTAQLALADVPMPHPSNPPPPPPPPPPQPTCMTQCDAWQPDYPSSCGKPYVNHIRDCRTQCSNGGMYSERERLCLPVTDYNVMSTQGFYGNSVTMTETEPFRDDAQCKGQWTVQIQSTFDYLRSPGAQHVTSTAWTYCEEN